MRRGATGRAHGRRCWRAVAAVVAAGITSSAGLASAVEAGATPRPDTAPAAAVVVHTVKGFLSLQDTDASFADECSGSGGYVDLGRGTPVRVRDGSGAVIAHGRFGAGRGSGRLVAPGAAPHSACVFSFVVKKVPETATYLFQVSHRESLVYSLAELEANNWRVGATLAG